jgi:S1-C subfamily serine protease
MKTYFVALLTLVATNGNAQPYPLSLNDIDSLSKSAVYLEVPASNKAGTGSLFTIPFSDSSESGTPYIATAKHITEKRLGNTIQTFDTVVVTLPLPNGSTEKRHYIVIHREKNLDIAILAPIETLRRFREYDVFSYSSKHIAQKTEIKRGQIVYLIGYPLNLGTKININPILQQGIVAQVDSGNNLVLVDIPINPGNSGCPVYILLEDGWLKLLGLAFQYQPSSDSVLRPKDDYKERIQNGMTLYEDLFDLVPINSSLGRVQLVSDAIERFKQKP